MHGYIHTYTDTYIHRLHANEPDEIELHVHMHQDVVSQVLVLNTNVKTQHVRSKCMVCLPVEMKQKPSSCKSSVHAQGSITILHTMHWPDNEGDLEVTAPMAETYANGTRTRAHGDAVVRKPMAL